MKEIRGELIISFILIGLLAILFNPWNTAMPDMMVMSLLLGLVSLFSIFVIFIWREKKGDEREEFHRLFADRMAFLVGSGVLIAGVIIQELSHAIDRWLIATLAFMVLAKVAGLIYSKRKL